MNIRVRQMFLNKQNTLLSASYKKHTIFPFLLHIHVSAANEKWFLFVLYKGTAPSFSEYFDVEGGYCYVRLKSYFKDRKGFGDPTETLILITHLRLKCPHRPFPRNNVHCSCTSSPCKGRCPWRPPPPPPAPPEPSQ